MYLEMALQGGARISPNKIYALVMCRDVSNREHTSSACDVEVYRVLRSPGKQKELKN